MSLPAINQTIFNENVVENMSLFELEEQEAIDFTIETLNAQKVSLSNISSDRDVVFGRDAITSFTSQHKSIIENEASASATTIEDIRQCTTSLRAACDLSNKSTGHKKYAVTCRLHKIVIEMAQRCQDDFDLLAKCLSGLHAIYDGYPDLFDESAAVWLMQLYAGVRDSSMDSGLKVRMLVMKIFKACTKMHEGNKVILFDKGISESLQQNYKNSNIEGKIVVCEILYNLCVDDDPRDMNSCFARATVLGNDFFPLLFETFQGSYEKSLWTKVVRSLSVLTCSADAALKQLSYDPELSIAERILGSDEDEAITYFTFNWLIALSGDDLVKSNMNKLIPFIINCMNVHINKVGMIQTAFLLISSMSLRNLKNTVDFISRGALDYLLQGMSAHTDTKLRRCGASAIRNMASSTENPTIFDEVGIIDFLKEICNVDEEYQGACKAALVALRAEVQLDEPWTGKRGDIVGNNDFNPVYD